MKRKLNLKKYIGSLFLFCLLLSCKPEDSNQYLGKYQYSGPPPDNKLLWNYIVDGKITTTPVTAQVFTPIDESKRKVPFLKIEENNLFMLWGTDKGVLYNFDYRKGKEQWANIYASPILSTPAILKDKAFFGLENGTFYSIDVLTGKELWKFNSSGAIYTDASVDETGVFYGTRNGIFYCLDKDTGKEKWKKSVNNEINSHSMIYKDKIYFGSDDGNLYALNKENGEIKWNFSTKGKIITIPLAYKNKIFVVSQDKSIYCLNAENGAFIWKYDLKDASSVTPSINTNTGILYMTSGKKLLYIDTNTGKELKSYKLSFKNVNPILYMDGFFYMTDKNALLYNIDESNGTIKWQYDASGKKPTAPYMFNGILHFGTDLGVIYAVGRTEDTYTYAPLIQKTEDTIKNKKGVQQFRVSYNVSSGIEPKGIWKKTYDLGREITSSFAFYNDFLYIAADKDVFSLRTDSEMIRWSYTTKEKVNTSPAIINKTLYFGDEKGNLIATDTERSDNIFWSYKTGSNIESSPYATKDYVSFGTDDGNIYLLSNQGALKWKFKTGASIKASPIINSDIVYFGSDDGYFYAIDIPTGKEKWKFKTNGKIRTFSALKDNKIYFGSEDGYFYCLNSKTGKEEWKFKTNGAVYSSPAISDDKICFASNDKKIYCLGLEKGEKIWDFEAADKITAPINIVDKILYVGSWDKNIYAFSVNDGKRLWAFQTSFPIKHGALVVSGTVYVASGTKVYGFQ
ncbi:MAG: PQQ-binding-like beta-propeller repeat protein [Candidatus Sericytochromatia bacterium]